MAYPAHALTVCEAFAFLLVISPLPWHLKAWNTGTCLFMFWCGLGCFITFVNTIVYNNTIEVQSAIWCEMSAKLLASTSYGIPASILCINRRLYIISRTALKGMSSGARMILTDLAIGLFMPAVFTGLTSLPQGHRGDIYEDIGCFQRYYNTIPAIIIQALPPVIIGVISGVYGLFNVHTFYKRRAELKRMMASSNMNIDFSDYYRLFYLGIADVIFTIPIATWSAYALISFAPVHPWIWSDIKLNYHLFWQFRRDEWEDLMPTQFKIGLWFNVLCAVAFFAFFGFTKEARGRYRRGVVWILKHFCMVDRPEPSLPPLQFQRDLIEDPRGGFQPDTSGMSVSMDVTSIASTNHERENIYNLDAIPTLHSDPSQLHARINWQNRLEPLYQAAIQRKLSPDCIPS